MYRPKYKNKKTIVDGKVFDSQKEARRYKQLKILEKQGLILGLRLQVKYELIPKQKGERACNYIADFVYIDVQNDEVVVEDVKGFRTPDYKIKRKLMLYIYGLRITEV